MKIAVDACQSPDGQPNWSPNTDVFVSTSGELIVMIELAGLSSGDLNLSVDGCELRIRGDRRTEVPPGGGRFLVMEIANGPFEARLAIPPAYDLASATAYYEQGFLRVVVPRRA